MPTVTRRAAVPALAFVLCLAAGFLTLRPTLGDAAEKELASGFAFGTMPINSAPLRARTVREVQPGLERIRSWISAVGAAVSLTDLRGLGHPADACLVDPRDDSVTVFAVPGSGTREYDRFTLEPKGLPYDHTMAPQGCVPADFDEDGGMDFLVYYWGRSPVLFLNRAVTREDPRAGDFAAHDLIQPMEVWNTSALTVADADGDGHLDIIAGNYFPDGARVLDPSAGDDQRMRMQHSMGKARNAGINRLLLTRPEGPPGAMPKITDASLALPRHSAHAWTLAFGWQDLTGNGVPDLYVANDFGPDNLLVNTSTPGKVTFTEVKGRRDLTTPGSQVLGYGSFKGMGVAFPYAPGDELPMITVSNITSPFALQESNFAFVPDGSGRELLDGRAPYSQAAERLGLARSGWSWDIKPGDFNNDGTDELMQTTGFLRGERDLWPQLQELAMGNDDVLLRPEVWPKFQPGDDLSGHEHNPFWARADDGRFYDLAERLRVDRPYLSRGLAFGDVNGDGALDALVASQWEDSVLLLNDTPNTGDAAFLRLLRPGKGDALVDAIGAQVEHRIDGQVRRTQLFPSNGHAGASASEAHLALPDGRPVTAMITWRDEDTIHQASVRVPPGHHTVELGSDGKAVLR